MQHPHRKLMRQFALFSLLAYLPFLLNSREAVFEWMVVHKFFLLAWSLGCLALGYLAVKWTDRESFAQDVGDRTLAKLIRQWASCPRCVGYWAGGAYSCLLAAFYWPRWPATVYFLLLGASLSASVSLAVLLYRMFRDYDPEDL